MPRSCLLYYITDRTTLAADELTRRRRLMDKIGEAVRAGVDYIQLREKDLSTRELESLAREAISLLSKLRTENQELRTAFLINSRTDVAIAVGADGVHLRSGDVSPREATLVWSTSHVGTAALGCSGLRRAGIVQTADSAMGSPLIAVSCHSPEEVRRAAEAGASFAVFAPVFGKKDAPRISPAGIAPLEQACREKIPVLALGGVTPENAPSCLEAGAAGIAGIRLFQENDMAAIVRRLRA